MLYVRSLPTIAAVLALAAAATAQVGTVYTFTQAVGSYTPITGGTQIAVCAGSSGATSLDDVTYPAVALPFTFLFEGAPYSAININSNGFVTFGSTVTNSYTAISSTAAYSGVVAAMNADLQAGFNFTADRTLGTNTLTNVSALGPAQVGDFITGTGIPALATITAIAGNVITMSANATSTGTLGQTQVFGPWAEIRTETLGSSPNRVFVVQWKNFKRWSSTGTTSQHVNLNFQIRLNEGSQVIEAAYGDCSPGVATTTTRFQVGLRGPTNTFPANVNNRMNTKGVNDDWSTSVAGTANSSGMLFNNVAPANVIANGLTYTWTPAGTFAINETLGQGCIRSFTSFYELFGAPANFDLAGNALTMTPAGGGYTVTPGGTFMPVASVQPVPTALALGDDAGIAQPFTVASFPGPGGPWTGVYVISNGCVSDIAGNTTTAAPVAATMLAAPRPGFYTQGDWDPTLPGGGAGTIWFEESASVVSVTWDNVQSWNHPGSLNTFQIQLHSNGNVVIAWVAMAAVGSNGGVLVGYSPGGPSADPGSTDLSATLYPAGNIVLSATDVLPLALAGTSRPVTGTNWGLNVTNIPPAAVGGIEIIGLADPGIIDMGFLGAPGCGLRSTLDALNVWIGAGASHAYSLPIPAGPALIGFQVFSTAAALVPGVNTLLGGTITANGVKGTVGDV